MRGPTFVEDGESGAGLAAPDCELCRLLELEARNELNSGMPCASSMGNMAAQFSMQSLSMLPSVVDVLFAAEPAGDLLGLDLLDHGKLASFSCPSFGTRHNSASVCTSTDRTRTGAITIARL